MDAVGHAEGIQDEQGHSAQQYLSRRSIRGRWRPNRSPYVCRAKWDVTADTLDSETLARVKAKLESARLSATEVIKKILGVSATVGL